MLRQVLGRGRSNRPPIQQIQRSESHIFDLFGRDASAIRAETRTFMFRYRSDDHWIDILRTYYGPVLKAFEMLDARKHEALTADLKSLIAQFNVARDGAMVVPGEYLQVVIVKR